MTTIYFPLRSSFTAVLDFFFASDFCRYAVQFDVIDGRWTITTDWRRL